MTHMIKQIKKKKEVNRVFLSLKGQLFEPLWSVGQLLAIIMPFCGGDNGHTKLLPSFVGTK